ncbi:hypothetical protein J7U46_20830 [Pelomonas sp. V22]|uniref:hypothetical protein n=1 Tax=Pelomonas sp. V22 TaxID=2822139 RepID=UPI0024A8D8B5|nr:hypothetical protein [Pelomonas sp. V22]MDI4635521.1 hypothetical protein [Pelomonas sp. V22]
MQTLLSHTTHGGQDLDLRPSVQITVDSTEAHECPVCHFCAPELDVDLGTVSPRLLVRDKDYQARLAHPAHPELARRLMAWAWLADACGMRAAAALSMLKAAWVCDDATQGGDMAARRMALDIRQQAAKAFEACLLAGESPYRERGLAQAVLADVLRRAQCYDEAANMAAVGLTQIGAEKEAEVVRDMLHFQWVLAHERNDGRCTIAQARAAGPGAPEREALRVQQQRERAEKRAQELHREQIRTSPLKAFRSLQSSSLGVFQSPPVARTDGANEVQRFEADMSMTTAPHQLVRILSNSIGAYGWRAAQTKSALALALMDRLPRELVSVQYRDHWLQECADCPDLVDYLRHCLRNTTVIEWNYQPGQRDGPGPHPPVYGRSR